eukprot:g32374.t1
MLPQPSLGPADTLEPVEPPSDPSTRVDTPQQPKMDPPSERADGVPQEPEPSERADTPHGQPDDPLPDTPQEPNMDAGTQLQDPKMDPPLPGPSQAPEQPSDLPDPQKADAQPVDEPGLEKPESENELPPQVIAETQLMDAPEAKVDPPNLPNPALPNPPGALPAALQQPVLPSLPKLALPIEPSMAPEQAQQPVQKADADVPKAAFTAQQPVQKAEAELPKAASEGPPDTKANASQPVEASKPLVDSDRKVKELQQQLRELGDRLIAMEAEKSKGAASSSSKGATWGSMPTFDATDVPLGDMLDGEPLDDDGTFDDALVGLIKETSSNGAREAAPATQAPSSNGSAETINFSTHRVAGMRMNRFMESAEGAKYPHMLKLFRGSNAEKRQLLRHWVENGGDKQHAKDIEASVVLSKSSESEIKGRMECISVLEMKRRGWPRNKILACVQKGGGIKDEHCPDDPLLTSYWSITERSKTDTETTKVAGEVRVGCEVTEAITAVAANGTMNRMMAPADPSGLVGGPGSVSDEQLKAIRDSIGAALLWRPDPPEITVNSVQLGHPPLIELEKFLERYQGWTNNPNNEPVCMPDANSQPVIDGAGTAFVPFQDGHVYAVRDANGDGKISPDEVQSHHVGDAFQASLAMAPKMLVALDCQGRLKAVDGERVGGARGFHKEILPKKAECPEPSTSLSFLQQLGDEKITPEQELEICEQLRRAALSTVARLLDAAAKMGEARDGLRKAALQCLCCLAAGRELDDEDGKEHSIRPSAADARQQLRSALEPTFLKNQLAHLLGYCQEIEDTEALAVLHRALESQEDLLAFLGEVQRAGLAALTAICDNRRRLGAQGAAVVPSQSLLKCLEAALHSSHQELVQALLAEVFALFADDEDRPQNMQVDLPELGLRILEPFLQSEEPLLRCNGLAGLSCLLAAKAKDITMTKLSPLTAMLKALGEPGEGRAQEHAAEALILAASDVSTRQRWIEGEGIEVILNALSEERGKDRSFVDAKLVAVLAIMAAHEKSVRDEVFDRVDFMMELRFAMEMAMKRLSLCGSLGESTMAANGPEEKRQARRLCCALLESFAMLSIHGEFKESRTQYNDKALSFFYAMLIHNLCRSREDKQRIKTGNAMIDDLSADDFKALEEFYERMPAEARPQRNGEVDAGDKALAQKMRAWCLQRKGDSGPAPVVLKLCRAASNGSVQSKVLAAESLRLLCQDQSHRKFVAASGGLRTLLELAEEPKAMEPARQALAQILISTNPMLLQYHEQLNAVRPLLQMFSSSNELYQFEGAMAFTNLLTSSEELRTYALQSGAWNLCKDLLFSDNEQAGTSEQKFLSLRMDLLRCNALAWKCCAILPYHQRSWSVSLMGRQSVAASGALAMLADCPEVAEQIASCPHCIKGLLHLLEQKEPPLQHRAMVLATSLVETEAEAKDVILKKVKEQTGALSYLLQSVSKSLPKATRA